VLLAPGVVLGEQLASEFFAGSRIDGAGFRLLRLRFLRGNYSRVRRVTVRLGIPIGGKDSIAA